jgi:membrane-associated phospholipid phosphatase
VDALYARRHEPRARSQLALLVAFVGACAAFGNIVEDYLTGDPIVRWDVEFAAWLHSHSGPELVSLFNVVTLLGNVAVLLLLTLAVTFLLLRRGAVDEAALVCVVALGIELLNGGLKLLFHRPRPELAYVHLDTYSFPSGHAAGATAIYGVLVFLALRRRPLHAKLLSGAAFAVLVTVIGFSRLYLEVHYLSDVLAGISLGLVWLTAWLFLFETYSPRSGRALLGPRLGRALNRIVGQTRR